MTTIVYSSPSVPPEWIAAHGITPTRLVPRSAVRTPALGAGLGVCPYTRAFVNEAVKLENGTAVVMTTEYDQMRRAAEFIEKNSALPLFLMNLPATWKTAAAQRLYLDELKRLGRFLVRLGGKTPSEDRLSKTLIEYDTARESLRETSPSMTARQFAEALADLGLSGPPPVNVGGERHAHNVPIAVVGGPLLRDDFYIFDLIEESGANIVLNATDVGERALPARFDRRRVNTAPMLELADAYFGTIPDAFRRPNTQLYAWLKAKFAERKVQGIIFHHYIWNDTWRAELPRLREWTDLPVLDLHAGDDDKNVRRRMENQIETFGHMLK